MTRSGHASYNFQRKMHAFRSCCMLWRRSRGKDAFFFRRIARVLESIVRKAWKIADETWRNVQVLEHSCTQHVSIILEPCTHPDLQKHEASRAEGIVRDRPDLAFVLVEQVSILVIKRRAVFPFALEWTSSL